MALTAAVLGWRPAPRVSPTLGLSVLNVTGDW